MELQFKETAVQAWQDLLSLSKTIPLAMESVVPDTKDDIGRILSVWPEIYLKSKDLRNHSAYMEGEARATVLYINEKEDAVASFSLSQSFSQEYELPGADDRDFLQVRLNIAGLQARVLNPRKLSVDMEIKADLTVFSSADVVVAQELPETVLTPIHLQHTDTELALTTGICEKSFSVMEQLSFPEDIEQPAEIIGKELRYVIREKEAVGSRLLIKGEAKMTVFYFAQNSVLPCSHLFTIPFSQLIDLGDENTETAMLWIEPSSDYLGLIENVNGRKQLDLELHALVQVRSGRKQKLRLITDAYSNCMPCECALIEQSMTKDIREKRILLSCEERIDLPEEFQELLFIVPSVGGCTAQQGSAAVELLCRAKDGKLFGMRRNLTLTADDPVDELTDISVNPEDFLVRQDGTQLLVQMRVGGSGRTMEQTVIRHTGTLYLEEEKYFDCAAYPSLTAVWAETESIWELAKLYHSSPEAIRALNQDTGVRPLFIPKTK